MITFQVYDQSEVQLLSENPMSTLQLSFLADEVLEDLIAYRPEFANLARLQRSIGCRVQELFNPDRWEIIPPSTLRVQPQKGNALRILQLSEINCTDAEAFAATKADMARLPSRQYERAFAYIIKHKGIWRLYVDGFARPSTHFFRHVKIKELYSQGFDKDYISTWIGEKSIKNLDYYLDSQFYI